MESDGPGRVKLQMNYRGGPELMDMRAIRKALWLLVKQLVLGLAFNRIQYLPHESQLHPWADNPHLARRILDQGRGGW